MLRRLAWLAAVLVLVALVPTSVAAPVSRGRLAAVRVTFLPADGEQVHVELTASRSDLGDRLEVGVYRCFDTCGPSVYYAAALPVGAVQLDDVKAAARVRALIRRTGLDVVWTPSSDGSTVVGGTHGGGPADDFTLALHRDDPADVHVTLGSHACSGPGYVGDAVQLATGDSQHSAFPLAALRLPKAPMRCDEPKALA